MNRVVITRPIMGICHMQVCAVKGAADDEILSICNRENPSGTTNGWSEVHRTGDPEGTPLGCAGPVQCADDTDREHILVSC